MSKIKLLFDVEKLSVEGTRGTGIVRVCCELIDRIAANENIDLYLLVPTCHGDLNTYLKAKGWEKRFEGKVVYMPRLKTTTKSQGFYQKLKSRILTFIHGSKYTNELQAYDAYLSPFAPISPIVYNSKIKTFMIIHDLIPIYYSEGCNKKYINRFTTAIRESHPNAYFCVSKHTAKDLVRFKPEAAKIPTYTLYLGADCARFKPINDEQKIIGVKEKYGIKTENYFLAVSEVTTRKNLVHLLKAFVRFLEKTKAKDISLVLVGPVRKGYVEVADQVKDLDKYRDKIVQTGFADDDDLAPLYAGAKAFIYPSLYEGFGLPVLEAMQCGTPVISADNTSLPEVGGDAVLYISGKDENETMNKLLQIYQNNELAMDLRQKGLARAKEFDWQKAVDVVVNVVINTCEEKKNV